MTVKITAETEEALTTFLDDASDIIAQGWQADGEPTQTEEGEYKQVVTKS